MISADYKINAGGADTTYISGSGFMIDLGYAQSLGDMVALGPQFNYYSYEYKKLKSGSTELTLASNFKQSGFVPALALWIVF